MACTTPKSPQPGHQIGFRSLLKSFAVSVQSEVMGSLLWLQGVFGGLALEGERHFAQRLHDLRGTERICSRTAERRHARGHVDEHAQEPVELSLVGLLDDEATLHRGEEVPVDAVRDRK